MLFFWNGTTVSVFLILRSRSGSFFSFTNFCLRLLSVSSLSVSVTATCVKSVSWLIDKLVVAYSFDFFNFTSCTQPAQVVNRPETQLVLEAIRAVTYLILYVIRALTYLILYTIRVVTYLILEAIRAVTYLVLKIFSVLKFFLT